MPGTWHAACTIPAPVEQTWLMIGTSLVMGLAAVVILVAAVRGGHFRDIEEAKFQVFWSDVEELVRSGVDAPAPGQEKKTDGN